MVALRSGDTLMVLAPNALRHAVSDDSDADCTFGFLFDRPAMIV